ncbi:DUF4040 domain-containing protein [Parvularcula sp. LCG005]|uniref:DUF4040 domain-containing protein n=1 Tax=Parvularcula sp. LCG005 TaxID=3078805 RepID=UPI002943A728|nr:DUF4040 domain-containing protein [Parvularcula sp. LCG005]WOI53963.1 DUF4040 domain-containing protein [Parvularcula sp. LCG005]
MNAEPLALVSTFETPLSPTVLLDVAILSLLVVCAVAMINMRRLFGVAMLSGVYSFLSALFFVAMDAVDVAFTEAAVGAGVSTVLVLSGMALASRREKPVSKQRIYMPLVIVTIVGAALIYATIDMPALGDPNSPVNSHVGMAYVATSPQDITVPNIVTGVLASYRGYDTFGETVVVFTAGIACLLLLGWGSMRGGRNVSDPEERQALGAPTPADEAMARENEAAEIRNREGEPS